MSCNIFCCCKFNNQINFHPIVCNNIHLLFILRMDPLTQQERHQRSHHQMHIYHQVMLQITILHKFISPTHTIISDSLVPLSKIIRDITMINIIIITHQTTLLMSALLVRVVVKIFILLRCLKVLLKRLVRLLQLATPLNLLCQYRQTLVITRLQKQRQRRKARRVAEDSKTRVPRDQLWMIHPRSKMLSRRKEFLYGILMRPLSFFIRY